MLMQMLFVVNPSAYLIEKVLMYMNDAIKCTKEEKINKRPHDRGNKLVQIQSMIKDHKIIPGVRYIIILNTQRIVSVHFACDKMQRHFRSKDETWSHNVRIVESGATY